MQQFLAQRVGGGGGQSVQHQAFFSVVGGAGADDHPGHPENAMQRVRGHVHAPHSVGWRGDDPPAKQPGFELNLIGGDLIASGRPTDDAQHEHHAQQRQAEPMTLAGAAAGEEHADKRRDIANQLPDRLDQQHPAAEPTPRHG
jgi:hypothetical protein